MSSADLKHNRWLYKESNRCVYKDNLLYRRIGLPEDSDSQSPAALRLYVPSSLRHSYLVLFHEHLCHLGSTRMAQVLRARYYWPGQSKYIYTHVKECHKCTLAQPPFRRPAAPKGPPVGSYPFDRVFVDIVSMAPTHDYIKGERGYSKLLVFVDSLSRWIEATPFNTDPTSEQVLNAYLSDVVCRHGTPRELRSNSGSNFISDLTSTILRLTGTDLTPTEAHHHEGVGLVERAQQTLVALARATNESDDHRFDHLPFLLMSMRASPNRLTSQSPASLLYGCELRLPSQIGDPRAVADVTTPDDLLASIQKYAELLRGSFPPPRYSRCGVCLVNVFPRRSFHRPLGGRTQNCAAHCSAPLALSPPWIRTFMVAARPGRMTRAGPVDTVIKFIDFTCLPTLSWTPPPRRFIVNVH